MKMKYRIRTAKNNIATVKDRIVRRFGERGYGYANSQQHRDDVNDLFLAEEILKDLEKGNKCLD